jgi:uroporphyrinogen-III synthase
VKQNLAPAEGPLLYASGAVTAGDLEKELGALGYRVRRVVLYEARPVPCLPSAAVEALAGGADGVLLYSPRTAQVWTDLVSQADLREQAARLMHYCLSGNVASVIEGAFGKDCPVAVAAIPEEPALLRLIGKDGSGLAVPSSLP